MNAAAQALALHGAAKRSAEWIEKRNLTTRALEAFAGMKPNPLFEPPVLELRRSQIIGSAR